MPFKQSTSMKNLTDKAIEATVLTKHLVIKATDFSTYFSVFLANSKGKDKTIALFQYLLQFFCTCAKHSNIAEMQLAYKKKQLMDMRIHYNVKESISSARKVFRLFRFFDEIKGLVKILKTDRPIAFKILSFFTYMCSIMYYITDNTLWLLNIIIKSGGLDKKVGKFWKHKKNVLSLSRVIAYTIILIYSIVLQKQQHVEKMNHLSASNKKSTQQAAMKLSEYPEGGYESAVESPVLQQSQMHKISEKFYSEKILESRRKERFLLLELALSFCRIQMLIKSLKLEGHEWLEPIYVAGLGVASSILNFLKAMFEKKIIVSIDKKQEKVFGNKNKAGSKFW